MLQKSLSKNRNPSFLDNYPFPVALLVPAQKLLHAKRGQLRGSFRTLEPTIKQGNNFHRGSPQESRRLPTSHLARAFHMRPSKQLQWWLQLVFWCMWPEGTPHWNMMLELSAHQEIKLITRGQVSFFVHTWKRMGTLITHTGFKHNVELNHAWQTTHTVCRTSLRNHTSQNCKESLLMVMSIHCSEGSVSCQWLMVLRTSIWKYSVCWTLYP